jgi:DNA-binding MarR family transcriptional regulator
MSDPQDPAQPPASAGGPAAPDGHPALSFDEVVHQRTRLGILAVLAEAGQADFPYLRAVLGLTDGNLGRHLEILAGAHLIMISKGYHRRRPRTWATITIDGRHALDAELANMRALLRRLEPAAASQHPRTSRQPVSSAAETTGTE